MMTCLSESPLRDDLYFHSFHFLPLFPLDVGGFDLLVHQGLQLGRQVILRFALIVHIQGFAECKDLLGLLGCSVTDLSKHL